MDRFTVRVELHGGTPQMYESLHTVMGRKGFSRTIKWKGDSTSYLMPSGEYNFVNESDPDKVLEMAIEAAKTVCENFQILVTPVDGGRAKYNLKTAS